MWKIAPIRFVLKVIVCAVISFSATAQENVLPGIARGGEYLPALRGKHVAVVINQTSEWKGVSLLDKLIEEKIDVRTVFVPEHGFRGTADAGAHIDNATDAKTGLPVVSLYGKNKKPSREQMQGIDVVVYDLQDVGVRFYTYISTLQYVMEACAENGVFLMVLDRPNPNAHLIDGPVLDTSLRSFVGMQPVPVLYGMTCGEYAMMLRGEGWIPNAGKLFMQVIPCENYTHKTRYTLPVAPSPNLKSMAAIYLYPGLCLFEGTDVSVGRGTDKPFEQWGHPGFKAKSRYHFEPKGRQGAQHPLWEDKKCYGQLVAANAEEAYELTKRGLDLKPLLTAYNWSEDKQHFFNDFFDKLAGNRELKEQIQQGISEEEIRKSWVENLDRFRTIREVYLLYKD